jgi:hypothetical protein
MPVPKKSVKAPVLRPKPAGFSASHAGWTIALFLFSYLGIVLAWMIVDYFIHCPRLPDLATADMETIDAYQNMQDLAVERVFKFFDLLVWKSFLPVLTAVIGYLFGVKSTERSPVSDRS